MTSSRVEGPFSWWNPATELAEVVSYPTGVSLCTWDVPQGIFLPNVSRGDPRYLFDRLAAGTRNWKLLQKVRAAHARRDSA